MDLNNAKNKKKPQPNIHKSKVIKQGKRWERDFREAFPARAHKYPLKSLEYLAEIMIEWAKSSPRNISFNEFLNHQNTLYQRIAEWSERCPKLKEAKKRTMQILGVNREKAAFFKEGDFKTMAFLQGNYDPAWKEREQYFNDMKIKANSALATPTEFAEISKRIFAELPEKKNKDTSVE